MYSLIGLLTVAAVVSASPMLQNSASSNSFWKGTTMDGVVKQLHIECSDHNDAVSCMKYKVLNFLDQVFSKESIQVSENIEIVQNSEASERSGRSDNKEVDVLSTVENYIRTHDVIAKLPGSYLQGTVLTLSPRNLDNDEISLNLKFSSQDNREGKAVQGDEGRKSKLKKIIIPVLVFVLLKAMTLIPLAIGVLGLKAWNALQLSFFSFVISVALAIFQLCKKIAADASSAQVAAHGPWDNYQAAHYVARSFPENFIPPQKDAQELAYNAYQRS